MNDLDLLSDCYLLRCERDEWRSAHDAAREEQERQRCRLATIVDEWFGPHEVLPTDALLTALERALAAARAERLRMERASCKTIDDRDARERQIERIHASFDSCEREWTNLHDLGDCAIDMAHGASGALAQARRERDEARDMLLRLTTALWQDDAPRLAAIREAEAMVARWAAEEGEQ